jgi:hypothetical protein
MGKIERITKYIEYITPYFFLGGAFADFYLYHFIEGNIQFVIFVLLLILNKLTRLIEIHKVYIGILEKIKEWAESKKEDTES